MVTVTHASLSGAAANPRALVDGPKWDAGHRVTGLEWLDGIVMAASLGFVGDNATLNDDALTAARAYCLANNKSLAFTGGKYKHQFAMNWGFKHFHVIALDDDVEFIHTGTGIAHNFDGMTNYPGTGGCFDGRFGGPGRIMLKGNQSGGTTRGVNLDNWHFAYMKVAIRDCATCFYGRDTGTVGSSSVATTFDVTVPLNGFDAYVVQPGKGIDFAGPVACIFEKLIVEGCGAGGNMAAVFTAMINCTFRGGTTEGNASGGFSVDSTSSRNTYINLESEANGSAADFIFADRNPSLIGCSNGGTTAGAVLNTTSATLIGGTFTALTNNDNSLWSNGTEGLTSFTNHGTNDTWLNPLGLIPPKFSAPGLIKTSDLASQSVTFAKIQGMTTATLLGNPNGTTTSPQEISITGGLQLFGTALRIGAFTGDITTSAGSLVTTLTTAQPGVHTWALTQTYTVAPVFTDASGTRTALSLGNVDNTSNATERAAVATLTNKTVNLTSNTLSGTTAQFNAALSDNDFATLAGTEALTNKNLNSGTNTFPTFNQSTTGSAATLTTPRAIDGQNFDGSAAITVIAPGTHAATTKATPVDADELPLVDSAASNVLKKLTWANLKATLSTLYAALASPTFTGTPAAPTAAVDTNTTQLATTAFVLAQSASATPLGNGTAAVGTSTRTARADHVHPIETRMGTMSATLAGVDFSVAGDKAVAFVLPPGLTRMIPWRIDILHASADISAATFGVFSTTGGGGVTLLAAGTSAAVTSGSDATLGNSVSLNLGQTAAFVATSLPTASTIYFRVGATAAAGRTGDVVFSYFPRA